MIPSNITKEHLVKAIQEIDKNGVELGAHSSTYDIVYNNKRYPPKLVVSLANKYANGQILPRDSFKGGQDQPAFQLLEKLGFKIENKETTVKLDLKDIKGEFAQWLLNNAPDSYTQYLGTSIQSVIERLNEIDAFFLERSVFEIDENNPLDLIEYVKLKISRSERKKNEAFEKYDIKNGSGIPKAILGKMNYLKFITDNFTLDNEPKHLSNQELYDLKSSFLKEWPIERLKSMKLEEYTNLDKTSFCYWLEAITTDVGSIWGGSAFKFGIFKRKDLESDNYNEKRKTDGEYSWYGKYGDSKEEVFEKIRNYIVNIAIYSQQNNLEEIDKIDLGDGYKWKIAFLYGDYNIINIFKLDALRKSAKFLGYNGKEKSFSVLNKFVISKIGDSDYYDFSKELWKEGFVQNGENNLNDSSEEQDFINRINNSSPKSLKTFFHVLDKLIDEIEIEDTESLVFSTGSNQLSFQVGKRYCLNLKKDKFSFIAPKNHLIDGVERTLFAEPDVALYYKNASYNTIIENYKAISDAVKFEIERDNHTFSKEYDNSAFRKAVFDKEYRNRFINFESDFIPLKIQNPMNSPNPLNTILYGPPGTGKTYNTINQALELCGVELKDLSRRDIKNKFEEKVEAGQIVFTTFHQSMSYEDFVEGIKPIEPEKEGDPVIYRVEEGIFKRLCIEASFNLAKENESKETVNVLDFSLAFDNFVQEIEEKLSVEETLELDTKNGGKVLVDSISQQGNIIIKHPGKENIYAVSKQRLSKLHTAFADLNTVHNIDQQFRNIIGGSNSTANWAVLNAIRNRNKIDEVVIAAERVYAWEEKKEVVSALKKEDYKGKSGLPFVLIIDEINRGNVSQILGELITLIEEDKRLGKDEALEVTLPYSKTKFGVPPNVFIIGTMNTADRSVEALDTALRRRFSFVAMPPKPQLLKTEAKVPGGILQGIDLVELLKRINMRIEKLLDKDHMIGHSYFLSVTDLKSLKEVFQNKIIPLLQEYFFGDYGKIGLVIGNGFFKEESNDVDDDFFAPFEDYDSGSLIEKKIYHLHNVSEMNEESFLTAINTLLRKK